MTSLKNKIAANQTSIGSWISLGHPAVAEIMARSGFEWLVVDLEHSVITIREAEDLIRTIELCGSVPLVRLSSNDPVLAKRVMDAGAAGIIVPMVNCPKDAEQAVRSVYYPRSGTRGVGLARAQGYGARFSQYREKAERETVVLVQIEHIEAVENLEAILKTPGVDSFLVGPYDLSASLGVPGEFNHPEFLAALKEIERVSSLLGKTPGIHIVEPNPSDLELKIKLGYRLIAYSVDIRMLDTTCRMGLSSLRSLIN